MTPTQKAELSFTYASAHGAAVYGGRGEMKDLGLAIQHLADGLANLSIALRQTYQLLAKVDRQTAPRGVHVEIGRAVIEG